MPFSDAFAISPGDTHAPDSPAPAVHVGSPVVAVERRRTHEDRPVVCLVRGATVPPYDLSIRALGAVTAGRFVGAAHAMAVPREEADRAPAGVMVDIVIAGGYTLVQDGRTAVLGAGDGVVIANRMAMRAFGDRDLETVSLMVPEALLSRRVGDVSRLAGAILPGGGIALRLLSGYLRGVFADGASQDAACTAMMGRHLVDLLVAAVEEGVGRPTLAPPSDSRAARLAVAKRLIDANAHLPTYSIHRVAAHLGCSERSVQMLFEAVGATFSGTLMERRLNLARERLIDPRFDHMTVRAVAESAGFSDPAHFARAYRRRYGETPGTTRGRT
jgi:AraC-like DNA-binding protein